MTTAATTTTFFIIDQRKRLASDTVQGGYRLDADKGSRSDAD